MGDDAKDQAAGAGRDHIARLARREGKRRRHRRAGNRIRNVLLPGDILAGCHLQAHGLGHLGEVAALCLGRECLGLLGGQLS